MIRLLLITLILLLTSCEQSERRKLEGSIDRVEEEIVTVVNFHDDIVSLRIAYADHHGIPAHQVPNGLQGFAVWSEWVNQEPDNVEYDCVIHTIEPIRVDDKHTKTLGHEMLHCLYGTYH